MLNFMKALKKKIKAYILRPFIGIIETTEERLVKEQKTCSKQQLADFKQQSQETAWLEYQVAHEMRLAKLREKVSNGGKVKVFFLVAYCAKFESKSVYKEMEQSDLYEPYIFVVHPRDRYFDKDPKLLKEAKANFELFKERGYRSIFGYNEYGKPLYLDSFHPDIVFYNNPNLWMWSHYNNMTINANYLTCHTVYFMDNSNLFENFRFYYRCNYSPVNTAWKCFEESYYSYYGITHTLKLEASPKISQWSGNNAVLSGFPKLDSYFEPVDLSQVPQKIQNGRPIIIYAPHWSIRYSMSLSTFHLFGRLMLQFARAHPEYNFVFKPHPELGDHIRDLNGCGVRDFSKFRGNFDMTPEQYSEYLREWDNLPNGVYVYDGEYIELFRQSSILITDCGSFIQEYLPSGHPCIYILNPEKKKPLDFYGELGKKVLSSYYLCNTWEQITDYLYFVLERNLDFKINARKKILSEEFVNLGVAGKFIVDYLTKEIT